jgi:DNA (cytosine-5)-methyltransferase 1
MKYNARFSTQYGVVDLFAGPGGLAEGFSAVTAAGTRPYRIVLSVEKDPAAYQTLLLRAFLRQFECGFPDAYYDFLNKGTAEPDWKRLFPRELERARSEALCVELGTQATDALVLRRIDAIRATFGGNTILIGGPPCQAYSLVGRARNKGSAGYDPVQDGRHFLYQSYISVLERLRPAVFVMENVKGLLSSSVDGEDIFARVLDDFRAACASDGGYRLLALSPRSSKELLPNQVDPRDFVVRAEEYGLPQARHRVIVIGLRADIVRQLGEYLPAGSVMPPIGIVTNVRHVLEGMPRLRSGLSKQDDGEAAWRDQIIWCAERLKTASPKGSAEFARRFRASLARVLTHLRNANETPPRFDRRNVEFPQECPVIVRDWLHDRRLKVLPNHETRAHMASDLGRYLFAAVFAEAAGRSPKAAEFPEFLAPRHENWDSGKFADRFRVQTWDRPSSTITSHISKDGHYFIHPDPTQCRSLTVREAARLQTFPDNYIFKGNRTQQFVQVGNAVPPLLAYRIACTVFHMLESHYGIFNQRMRVV